MAGRILNRRDLREQATQAQQAEAAAQGGAAAVAPKAKKARKAPAAPRAKKAAPRLRARWGVFDGGMRQVAIFDYNQRAAADEKVAALLAKDKGLFFLQIVKEPMPEPAPAEGPGAP
jgi:hypothetical protein